MSRLAATGAAAASPNAGRINRSRTRRSCCATQVSISPVLAGRHNERMIAPDLPAELKAALEAKLQGLSRNAAAGRAALISKTYRDGGGSGAITSQGDALAYALTRMPATYAAVTAGLNALRAVASNFAPASLLDVGAGPGTASWAAAEAFSSLHSFHLVDANRALRALALDIASNSARLRAMNYRHGEARA